MGVGRSQVDDDLGCFGELPHDRTYLKLDQTQVAVARHQLLVVQGVDEVAQPLDSLEAFGLEADGIAFFGKLQRQDGIYASCPGYCSPWGS